MIFMRQINILLLFSLLLTNHIYGQQIELKLDKNLNNLEGTWIYDSINTKPNQGQIGINRLEIIFNDTIFDSYSKLLSYHMDNFSIDGIATDKVELKVLSYGEIEFQSYKFNKPINCHAYCTIFDMLDSEIFLMFADFEDENEFIGLPFKYSLDKNLLIIEHKELGQFGFKKQ
jgi:hypothetical protein